MEQITDDRLVSQNMIVPGFFACNIIGLTIRLDSLYVRLFLIFVQVLRHEVKNCIDTLLRILLTIAFEGHVVLTENSLEEIRADDP